MFAFSIYGGVCEPTYGINGWSDRPPTKASRKWNNEMKVSSAPSQNWKILRPPKLKSI